MQRWFHRLGAWLYTHIPLLGRLWARRFKAIQTIDGIPWSPLAQSLAHTRFALVTTGGPHLRTDAPFDMADPHGDPSFRAIPASTHLSDIIITHDYYDHTDADADLNIILPITRMHELVQQGVIAGIGTCYGFMGHITDEHVATLINITAPAVARRMRDEGITAALLTPA